MSKIDSLVPSTFTYLPQSHDVKEDPRHYVGFIAEDVEEVYPEFVNYEPDGVTPRSLQYENMVALLVTQAKEFRKEIQFLKEQVQNLKHTLL